LPVYANLGPQYFGSHGFLPLYRLGEANRCPACLKSNWLIGRSTAECAFCGTALPLEHTGLEGVSLGGLYWDRDVLRHGWHFRGRWSAKQSDLATEWKS
jgi:hypothetical protein